MLRSAKLGYALIFFIGAALCLATYEKAASDYDEALQNYRQTSADEASISAKKIEDSLNEIYQNIRTISLLPGVRKIARHGENIDPDAHAAIQQIYNDLASNVAVSEVYVVPADIDPEAIDPATGKPQAPILSFDELIVDADKKNDNAAEATAQDGPQLEEVEIFEYRLLRKQMTYLASHYGEIGSFQGLNAPMIGGPEVITCDNSQFKDTRKDADRSGIVLSVPFYGEDGKFKGTVSAIIRTNAIRDLLPAANYALVSSADAYVAPSVAPGQVGTSRDWVAEAKPDPSLFFSMAVPLRTTDPRSQWSLWVGYPDAMFLQSAPVKAIHMFEYVGYAFSLLLVVLCVSFLSLTQRNLRLTRANDAQRSETRAAEIEQEAAERALQKEEIERQKQITLQHLADEIETTVNGVVATIGASSQEMRQHAETLKMTAERTSGRTFDAASASEHAASNVVAVTNAAGELAAAIAEIDAKVTESTQTAQVAVDEARITNAAMEELSIAARKIGEVVHLINEIANQTNLLALNATIEAARAGDAGKGFAIVAGEVKNLASQTAKATDEIASQIAAMQTATTNSAAAIRKIGATIERISEISSDIAAAVDRQDATAQKISQEAQEAANSTRGVASNITSVTQASNETSQVAERVLTEASELATASGHLRHKVEQLIADVRAA